MEDLEYYNDVQNHRRIHWKSLFAKTIKLFNDFIEPKMSPRRRLFALKFSTDSSWFIRLNRGGLGWILRAVV